jgi:vancomycin resistance protein VanJ
MLRFLFWLGLWSFGLAVLAALVLRGWTGDAVFLARYVGYVMPWLLLGLVPGALVAARARRGWLAALLAATAALVVGHHAPVFRYRPAVATPPTALTVRVLSYNTWSRNADDGRIAGVVLRSSPDILLLQEIEADVFTRVLERLRVREPGLYSTYDRDLMQAVVSRYPTEPQASLRDKGHAQKVVVRSPAGPITVYNVHPQRSGGWTRRYDEVAALLEGDILRESGPVLVGGDFNVTPHSQMYLLLARHLRNAHDEAGSGVGFTFPSSARPAFGVVPIAPLLRIDHVFFSGHFLALSAGTVDDAGGSDHHPVFAELAQRPSGRATGETPQVSKSARKNGS